MAKKAAAKASWRYVPGMFGGGNCVLDADGFYISFNAAPPSFPFGGSDDGSSETALCKDGEYRILNGDFRADYEKLAPKGFAACLKFYESKRSEHESSWTTPSVASARP